MRKLFNVTLLLIPLILRAGSPSLPPEKELKAHVLETLLAFNKAAQENSFAGFRRSGCRCHRVVARRAAACWFFASLITH